MHPTKVSVHKIQSYLTTCVLGFETEPQWSFVRMQYARLWVFNYCLECKLLLKNVLCIFASSFEFTETSCSTCIVRMLSPGMRTDCQMTHSPIISTAGRWGYNKTDPTNSEQGHVISNNTPVFRVLSTRNQYSSGIQIRDFTVRSDVTISCYITYTNHFTWYDIAKWC